MLLQFDQVNKKDTIIKLYKCGVIQFGEFTLASGKKSPVYIDMKLIVSYPVLLEAITFLMWEKIQEKQFDVLCGVPIGAVPIATALSLYSHKPMILARKQTKDHGRKKLIEGVHEKGTRALIIEDVITTGGSVLRAIKTLNNHEIVAHNVVTFLDREQGASQKFLKEGIVLDSVCTLNEVIDILHEENHVNYNAYTAVKNYLQQT